LSRFTEYFEIIRTLHNFKTYMNESSDKMEEISKKNFRSREEIEKILKQGTMGFLGMCKDGMPYVIPLTYVYVSGKIIFHCALQGKKLEYIMTNPQVCFAMGSQSGKTMRHPQGGGCKADNDSAVCYGKARIIDDLNERCRILNTFNQLLRPGSRKVLLKEVERCHAVEITINEMTGRRQRKGIERTYWSYCFKEEVESKK
jgi:nitroimidazol reductase NimA-like FMN-containing flavoprotein (pyridoxamine 5'-phosphate oxidase superfamily)